MFCEIGNFIFKNIDERYKDVFNIINTKHNNLVYMIIIANINNDWSEFFSAFKIYIEECLDGISILKIQFNRYFVFENDSIFYK